MNIEAESNLDLDMINADPDKLSFDLLKSFAKKNGIKMNDIYDAAKISKDAVRRFRDKNDGFAHPGLYYSLIGLIALRRAPKTRSIQTK